MSQNLINDCVQRALDQYFRDLGDQEPVGLHELMVRWVERPLLEQVM